MASTRRLSALPFTITSKAKTFSMHSPSSLALKTPHKRKTESFTQTKTKPIKFPSTPSSILKNFKDYLNELEVREILEYKEIFYIGNSLNKRLIEFNLPNYGYDDKNGDYIIIIGDHIEYRYEIQKVLGKGSFGQVVQCFDHKTKDTIALKIIKNKKNFHKQALVEIKILQNIKNKDLRDYCNIVKMNNKFLFRNHPCISFELLSINLYQFIKLNNFSQLSLELIARFAVQILIGLEFVESLHIVHCDLKPENIMLKHPDRSEIKIIDFGSGCYESKNIYTYIQSRFYRAPEILLGLPYDCKIDMWSFACILAELYRGMPLFPGENEQEQLLRIIEVLGIPDEKVLLESSRKKLFFDEMDQPIIVPNSRGKIRVPGTRPLAEIVGEEDLMFLDFLQRILVWNPKIRPTPTEALNHPWLVKIFNRQPSPTKKRGEI